MATRRNNGFRELYESPAYGMVEAALYLRVPYQTIRYWLTGFGRRPPLIRVAVQHPIRLSFMNLLECHMLSAMRSVYNIKVPRVRRALHYLSNQFPSKHPLLDQVFETDGVHLFVQKLGQLIVADKGGQLAMRNVLEVHLQRIEKHEGLFRFFPFVMSRSPNEPRFILIDPQIGFGKPVISGTGIATRVIAARFNARESIRELAEEYGCSETQIEEAIRWEEARPLAA